MKKIVIIVLLALAVAFILCLCFCDNNGESIPFEECIQIAVGQWDDPLGHAPSVVLNEDKTAEYMDETFTWDVTWSQKARKDDSYPHDSFVVYLYDAEGTEKYRLSFDCDHSEQIWQIDRVNLESDEGGEEFPYRLDYLFKTGSVDVIRVDENNFDQYFEFLQIFEWKNEQRDDWNYLLYLVVKPEYEEKVLETNWTSKIGVTVERRNYNIFVDAENDTVKIGDVRDPDSEPTVIYEELELHMYKADYRYKEGYLTLAYIFMPKDYTNNSYVSLAEYCSLAPMSYTLVLKK